MSKLESNYIITGNVSVGRGIKGEKGDKGDMPDITPFREDYESLKKVIIDENASANLQNQINIVKNANRKFKKYVGVSPYWGETTGTSGSIWNKELQKMKDHIDYLSECYIDELVLTIHIGYNANTKKFFIVENTDNLIEVCKYAITKNVTPIALRMLAQGYSETDINSYGVELFKSKWLELIDDIASKFKTINTIKYLTVHNEVSYIYGSVNYESFVIECINKAQSYGYKSGVTSAGFEDNYLNVLENIKQASDCLFINHYQKISNKGEKTTLQDSVNAWDSSIIQQYISMFKEKYNKEIIMSETGCQDTWNALAEPGRWNWSVNYPSNSNAPYIYHYGELNSLNNTDLSRIWIWYDIEYDNLKELFKFNLGGVKDEL